MSLQIHLLQKVKRVWKFSPQINRTWISELILIPEYLHECMNFIEFYFNQKYTKHSFLLFKWMKISANETYFKYYSSPIRRFYRFPFYSSLCLWLISQPNNLWFFLNRVISQTGSYLYPDDTCIFYQDKDVEKNRKSFKQGTFVTLWMVYRQ